MIERSEKFTEFPKAFLKAQIEIKGAKKDAWNPHFKCYYADLESVINAVKEPLNSNSIMLIQHTVDVGDKPQLETILMHESGEWIAMRIPILFQKEKDPQAFGSGLTYAKRFSLQALIGLPSEDDDGNGATTLPKSKVDDLANSGRAEPSEQEIEFLNKVWEKLVDSAPEGMEVNEDKLNEFIYGLRKSYVSDMSKVKPTVDYVLKQINKVCVKK